MSLKTEKIWLDGELVRWEDAKVHVLAHALHYGTAYFEGIRCYALAQARSAVFRLQEHIRRLADSGKILGFPLPYTEAELCRATIDVIRANRLTQCYIRPLAFVGLGELGLYAPNNPINVCIAVWPWGAYLGDEGLQNGIRAKVSSFTRHHVNVMMTKTKASGNYINSVLAKHEVKKAGYDEAIMLDPDGYVSEASGENIFIVRDGIVIVMGVDYSGFIGAGGTHAFTPRIGVQYDASPRLGVRAGWQRYDTDEEVDLLSIGFLYRF